MPNCIPVTFPLNQKETLMHKVKKILEKPAVETPFKTLKSF